MTAPERLTPVMRQVLADALRARPDDDLRAPVTGRPATVKALIARGLAMPDQTDDDGPPILTRQGVTAAAKVIDPERPTLQPGDLVVYHGSIEFEHDNEYIVLQPWFGRYRLVDAEYHRFYLDQARRTSISYTGHQVEVPEIFADSGAGAS
ncbi:hypothetical protein [Actinomadura sp. K4S16]|uniref:hypothetical protein n=1 Tax=Actinomadura sp. K4S16 TaxID=1316147 RepID=UPI0011ED0121|nr:hypothetical protein [Actinomadura sp. K4S16]